MSILKEKKEKVTCGKKFQKRIQIILIDKDGHYGRWKCDF